MVEKRTIQINSRNLEELEKLVENYPRPTVLETVDENNKIITDMMYYRNCLNYDLEVYRDNRAIVDKVVEEWNSYFSTEDIVIDLNAIHCYPYTVLEVKYDSNINKLIERALKLQSKYLDIVLHAGRGI